MSTFYQKMALVPSKKIELVFISNLSTLAQSLIRNSLILANLSYFCLELYNNLLYNFLTDMTYIENARSQSQRLFIAECVTSTDLLRGDHKYFLLLILTNNPIGAAVKARIMSLQLKYSLTCNILLNLQESPVHSPWLRSAQY